MKILQAVCDRCCRILESTKENEIRPDCNGEILCESCQKDEKRIEIKQEMKKVEGHIRYSEEELDRLRLKLNELGE